MPANPASVAMAAALLAAAAVHAAPAIPAMTAPTPQDQRPTPAPPRQDPAPAPAPSAPLPTESQRAWADMEFTGFIHFGPNTFMGNEWGHGTEDPRAFAPSALDARQWARVMREAGMRGVVITAKHHDGFCLWPSRLSTHTVAASPFRGGAGDVLKEFSEACAAEGLKFGVYLSPWDRNHPAYGSGTAYNDYFKGQLREVLSGYGPIHEVWFDGACGEGPDGRRQEYDWAGFIQVVRELQPQAVIFSDVGPDVRWVGNEQGHAGETNWCTINVAGHGRGADNPPPTASLWQGDEEGAAWIPAECDVSIRPGWFWHERDDERVKTPAELLDLWERSVGHNANFHLNVPPDRRGLLHERDVAALRGLRALLDATYGRDLAAGATATGAALGPAWSAANLVDGRAESSWAAPADAAAPSFELRFPAPVELDRVNLEEDLRFGQRVRTFTVEILRDGAWSPWASGTTIGHRRILRGPPVRAEAVRVTCTGFRAPPVLRRASIHRTPAEAGGAAGGAAAGAAAGAAR